MTEYNTTHVLTASSPSHTCIIKMSLSNISVRHLVLW